MGKREPVIPTPAIVQVKARCGHFDTHLIGPGETIQIEGTFTLCAACNTQAEVTS